MRLSLASALALLLFSTSALAAEKNPCDDSVLNIVNRPSAADSACVVPYKKAMFEAGYQYQQLTQGLGHQQNYPQAELRVGLPWDSEALIIFPNRVQQARLPHLGYTATALGAKHMLLYNENMIATVEALMTLPSGSAAFGSKALGGTLNGILSYTLGEQCTLVFQIGGETVSAPSNSGGQRYSTVNPALVLYYSPTARSSLYAQVYGQTKTGPNQGSGFSTGAGFLYAMAQGLSVDIEGGQRISGKLGSINHYIGAGFAWLI